MDSLTSTRHGAAALRLKVLFFGAARDAVGTDEMELTLDPGSTSAQAIARVMEAAPNLRRFGASLLLAVNQEYARAPRELKDGDELALFPPVSGGSA
jgi:molybdopterin converting factor subunit 1